MENKKNIAISSSFTTNRSFNTSHIRNGKTPNKHSPSSRTPARTRLGESRGAALGRTPKTPHGADRFIPDRNNINFDLSHYLVFISVCFPLADLNIFNFQINNDTIGEPDKKPNTISELVGDLSNCRVVSYNNKAPPPPEGHLNNLKVVYSSSAYKPGTTKKPTRYIPSQPERILDAPDIINDYYLQLIDWSHSNVLAVALKNEVYLWNAATGSIDNLLTLDESEYISSLSWANECNFLAVGTSTGQTQLWDIAKGKCLRKLNVSEERISTMNWNNKIVSCGSKDGNIYNHDVSVAMSLQSTYSGHSQEICGLKWSPSGQNLASGGNDNTVNVWSSSMSQQQQAGRAQTNSSNALYTFTDHQAAVKAIAWCPWRPNCLATGGGTADRMIRIWNVQNGQNIYSVDTQSQVSSILWSSEYKELISSHGYMNNELIIWKYPTLTKVAELTGKLIILFALQHLNDLICLFSRSFCENPRHVNES